VQKCVDVASSSSVFKSEEGTNEALLEEKVDQKQELQKLQEKIKQMDEFSERLMKELPKMPDDHEFRHVFGSTLIRDPSRKVCFLNIALICTLAFNRSNGERSRQIVPRTEQISKYHL
jgi:hypothetical protein